MVGAIFREVVQVALQNQLRVEQRCGFAGSFQLRSRFRNISNGLEEKKKKKNYFSLKMNAQRGECKLSTLSSSDM